jgi:hypothetical protein
MQLEDFLLEMDGQTWSWNLITLTFSLKGIGALECMYALMQALPGTKEVDPGILNKRHCPVSYPLVDPLLDRFQQVTSFPSPSSLRSWDFSQVISLRHSTGRMY